jgi:hypothetical protein
MMEIIKTISGLAPIIGTIILVVNSWVLESRRNRPILMPHQVEKAHRKPLSTMSLQKGLFQTTWLVLLVSLLCMAYVLPEVFTTGELTGLSVYKIVMGIGYFFFLLLQSSISQAVDANQTLIKSLLIEKY